jgi:non-lysosomal glucosylceramidase
MMSLSDALSFLPFVNSGLVTAATNLTTNYVDVIYLEPEAPTRARWAWADGHITPFSDHRYIFEGDRPGIFSNASVAPPLGMRSAPPLGGLASGTVELRADGSLRAWTIENAHPASSTKTGWLDAASLGVWVDGAARLLRTHPPAELSDSGVSALNFSGSSPFTRLIPIDSALPEACELRLYGRSRWRVGDMAASALPALAFTLTAVNPNRTAPLDLGLFFSLPLQLQMGMQRTGGEPQPNGHNRSDVNVTSAAACARACQQMQYANESGLSAPGCVSWSFENASASCALSHNWSSVPAAHNSPTREFAAEGDSPDGAGVVGTWHLSSRAAQRGQHTGRPSSRCLVLHRNGTHAAAGEVALCAAAETTGGDGEDDGGLRFEHSTSFASAPSLADLWAPFAAAGTLEGPIDPNGLLGGGAVRVSVPPGAKASLTLSLGWRFPHREFMGDVIGNQYASLYADAEAAAEALLEASPTTNEKLRVDRGGEDASSPSTNAMRAPPFSAPEPATYSPIRIRPTDSAAADVADWAAFASLLTGEASSLPVWLGDSLLNTLHHARSTFWLADGRFRQWESFSCVNVDSVHNDGERHLPYLLLWPQILPSKMEAWAAGQQADGMIQEQLACGCMDAVPPKLDAACGRTMGDVSSMFIVYLYEFHLWGPLNASARLVQQLWPAARAAALWQMNRANRTSLHLPDFLVDTYDGLNLAQYNASAFSAFFHLLAMRAASELARLPAVHDPHFASACETSLEQARAAIDEHLWSEWRGVYRAYTPAATADPVMADALYAQVLSDTLGLGTLHRTDDMVRSHLDVVLLENDTPYGLLAMTGRHPYPGPNPRGNDADNSVWMMANPNWSTLSLWRGGDIDKALAVAETTFSWWRDGLKDMWNVVAIHGGLGYNLEGQPLANSHYGYHMVAWHMLFALSGQQYSAPEATVRLAPRLSPPYELPVLVPGTAAKLACTRRVCQLRVVAGISLRVSNVSVHGVSPPEGKLPTTLAKGDAIEWDVS